jgi:energy-coupling factor transporter ATP-binding protein EcfA2
MAKSTQQENQENLPVYFLDLSVENVRCFGEKQTLHLSDGQGKPARWTVLLGDNGTGKTTLLKCLVALEPDFTNAMGIDFAIPKVAYNPFSFLNSNSFRIGLSKLYKGSFSSDELITVDGYFHNNSKSTSVRVEDIKN